VSPSREDDKGVQPSIKCFGYISRGVLHVCRDGGSPVDICSGAEVFLEDSNHRVDRDWCVSSTKVDDGIESVGGEIRSRAPPSSISISMK
jgi:hypothetical protein